MFWKSKLAHKKEKMQSSELLKILSSSMSLDSLEVRSYFNENPCFERSGPGLYNDLGFVYAHNIFMICKELGIEMSFDCEDNKSTSRIPDHLKTCVCIWLYSDVEDGREYNYSGKLPLGFKITDTRLQLINKHTPKSTWKVGDGNVDVNHPNPSQDRWEFENMRIAAFYCEKSGLLKYFEISNKKEK